LIGGVSRLFTLFSATVIRCAAQPGRTAWNACAHPAHGQEKKWSKSKHPVHKRFFENDIHRTFFLHEWIFDVGTLKFKTVSADTVFLLRMFSPGFPRIIRRVSIGTLFVSSGKFKKVRWCVEASFAHGFRRLRLAQNT
jgi:hypothetical protein